MVFPDALKTAIMPLIYKTKGKNDTKNYRSISILPSTAKIIDTIVNSNLGILKSTTYFWMNTTYVEETDTHEVQLQF